MSRAKNVFTSRCTQDNKARATPVRAVIPKGIVCSSDLMLLMGNGYGWDPVQFSVLYRRRSKED